MLDGAAGVPARQVRAVFDEHTIVVYQAYPPAIAEAALAAGRFVPPFKLDRMTWIKPSFLWMMYRCGWGTKPDQERVVAVTITRDGFEWTLAHACLSHHDPAVYRGEQAWAERKHASPVRIQWDPERNLTLDPLPHRAIQIGLGGEAAHRYVNDWTVRIDEITPLARDIRRLVVAGHLEAAADRLPAERPYPLSDQLRTAVGAS
jgi:Domain of unknown function (DUF4291)